jgi:hypothetical protein
MEKATTSLERRDSAEEQPNEQGDDNIEPSQWEKKNLYFKHWFQDTLACVVSVVEI